LNISYLIVYLALILLIIGAIYKYRIRRFNPDIGNVISLIVFSGICGSGLALFARALSVGVFNSSVLGELGAGETKAIIFIGSLCGLCAVCYSFIRFLKQ
jgi:hypothetical protein